MKDNSWETENWLTSEFNYWDEVTKDFIFLLPGRVAAEKDG